MKFNNVIEKFISPYYQKESIITDVDDVHGSVWFDFTNEIIHVQKDMSFQALYSYVVEWWWSRAPSSSLFPFDFTTPEQFQIGGDYHGSWTFSRNSHHHIKSAGWNEALTGKKYMGVVTLGDIGENTAVIINISGREKHFAGQINEAIEFSDSDNFISLLAYSDYGLSEKILSAVSSNEQIGVDKFDTICYRFPLSDGRRGLV